MFQQSVIELLNFDVAHIIKDARLSILLIRTYSKCYANGNPVGYCERSQRRFYNQLNLNGMETAKKMDDVKNRTCKPNWIGNKYINQTGKHWSSELLTDDDAIYLLTNGFISESKFDVLPENYKNEVEKLEVIINSELENVNLTEEITTGPIYEPEKKYSSKKSKK